MKITLRLPPFYSLGDERRFFLGLSGNPAVREFHGVVHDLEVVLVLKRLNSEGLRDLIALLWRYGIPLTALAGIAGKARFQWMNDPSGYWYKNMFAPIEERFR